MNLSNQELVKAPYVNVNLSTPRMTTAGLSTSSPRSGAKREHLCSEEGTSFGATFGESDDIFLAENVTVYSRTRGDDCSANMAHTGHSRPDSCLGVQVRVLETSEVVFFAIGGGESDSVLSRSKGS